MKQVVRLLGGLHRGKKITFPSAQGLRPTPSRVRETLFNWLMHDIRDAHCLDAFAGSGALGFEAWSRGARTITLIEPSRAAFLSLDKHIQAFESPKRIKAIQTDILHFLKSTPDTFDIIFLDAPFNNPELLEHCIAWLETHHTLNENGLIYTESPSTIVLNTKHWKTLKHKKNGLVFYALHQKLKDVPTP